MDKTQQRLTGSLFIKPLFLFCTHSQVTLASLITSWEGPTTKFRPMELGKSTSLAPENPPRGQCSFTSHKGLEPLVEDGRATKVWGSGTPELPLAGELLPVDHLGFSPALSILHLLYWPTKTAERAACYCSQGLLLQVRLEEKEPNPVLG